MSPFLTQAEAARVLRCHPSTVLRLRRSGQLRAVSGCPVRILKTDLNRWIETHLTIAKSGLRTGGTGSAVLNKDRAVVQAKMRATRQAKQHSRLLKLVMK